MSTAIVTYNAPAGDDAVVTTRGVRFFDGQPQELDLVQHAALIAKCRNSPHFEVIGGEPSDRMEKARAAKVAKSAAKVAEEPEE